MQEMYHAENNKNKKHYRLPKKSNDNNNDSFQYSVTEYAAFLEKNKKEFMNMEVPLIQESNAFQELLTGLFRNFIKEYFQDFLHKNYETIQNNLTTFINTHISKYNFLQLNRHEIAEALESLAAIVIERFEEENFDNSLFYQGVYDISVQENQISISSEIINASSPSRFKQGKGKEIRYIEFSEDKKSMTMTAYVTAKNKIVKGYWEKIYSPSDSITESIGFSFQQTWIVKPEESDGYSGTVTFIDHQHVSINLMKLEEFNKVPLTDAHLHFQTLEHVFYVQAKYESPQAAGSHLYALSCKAEQSTHLGLLQKVDFDINIVPQNNSTNEAEIIFSVPSSANGDTQRLCLNVQKAKQSEQLLETRSVPVKAATVLNTETGSLPHSTSSSALTSPEGSPIGSQSSSFEDLPHLPPLSSSGKVQGVSASQLTLGIIQKLPHSQSVDANLGAGVETGKSSKQVVQKTPTFG